MSTNNSYPTHTRTSSGTFLSEEYVQDAFHSYLKSSLTQAKLERLLDEEVLSSAEGDLMITGPALCLYFAALRCTTNPPSVPLPRFRKDESSSPNGNSTPTDLSYENCPPTFRGFLSIWAECVPKIQSLTPENQHELARIICGLGELSPGRAVPEAVYGIAADLRAVAIEISQRRSFQNRYASDLQAALDSNNGNDNVASTSSSSNRSSSPGSGLKIKASFVPPPSYEETSPTTSSYSSAHSSPNFQMINLPQDLPPQDGSHLSPFSTSFSPSPDGGNRNSVASTATSTTLYDDTSPRRVSSPPFPVPQIPIGNHGTYYPPQIQIPPPVPPKDDEDEDYVHVYNTTQPLHVNKQKKDHRRTLSATSTHSTHSTHSTQSVHSRHSSTPSTPSIITPTTPSIDIIRETLYAALADVLSTHSSLRALLKLDPPRAYFGAVSLAILSVASTSVSVNPDTSTVTVHGVLGTELTIDTCPDELVPFMKELGEIAKGVRKIQEDDDERVIKAIQEGREGDRMPEPRLEGVKRILEEGVGGMQSLGSLSRVRSAEPSSSGGGGDGGNGGGGGGNGGSPGRKIRHRRTPSPSNRTLTFANRINALALGMVGLKAFRERQGEVFKVLAGAGAGGGV